MQNEKPDILKRYKELTLQRNMLKTMLSRLNELTGDDIILSMNYQKPYSKPETPQCVPANQTQYIAINYWEEYRKHYETEFRECFDKLIQIDKELLVIEAAIKQLPEHYQQLIQLIVIEGETWETAEQTLSIARSTISNWRKNAITLIEKYCASFDI